MKSRVKIVWPVLALLASLAAALWQTTDVAQAQRRWSRPAVSSTPAPQPKSPDEALILETIRNSPRYANVPDADGRFLRILAESIGARRVVEIGGSTGVSALWFSLALLKTGGHLISLEIDPRMIRIARENFHKAGVSHLITHVEGNARETLKQIQGPVDLVFIDADKDGYLHYLETALPLVRPGGLIVAHNYLSTDEKFRRAITENPALDTVILTSDGEPLSVSLKKR